MLRQVNLAHFALAFLGGYLTFQLAGRLDPFTTLAITVPLFFLAGMALHWFLSRYAADMAPPSTWDEANWTRAAAAWPAPLASTEVASKSVWRDERLAALVAHKRLQRGPGT